MFDYFPGSVWQTEEGKEMYANLLEQQGLLFWQRLYLDNDEQSLMVILGQDLTFISFLIQDLS